MIKWHTETWPIEKIRDWGKNPRIIQGKKWEDFVESITKYGYATTPTVNLDGTLIGGHARLLKARSDQETEIEVKVPDRQLSDKEHEELGIRLNKNIAGEWDWEKLIQEFEAEEIIEWGFDEKDFPHFGGSDDIGDESSGDGEPKENRVSCPHCGKEFDANKVTAKVP